MELKNRDIKPMKKYLIISLVFLFTGCCSVTPIESINGSFKDSLNSEYYKKTTYFSWEDPYRKAIVNADIDNVIQQGLIAAYFLNRHMVVYSRANKNGDRSNINDDTLLIVDFQIK